MGTIQVFVSYSHEDVEWFEEGSLMPRLVKSLEREGAETWYDRKRLGGGDWWRQEIEDAIDKAQIAILLVSQDFLNSEFIRDFELPRIEARAEKRELVVIPILVGNCDWQGVSLLNVPQMLPGKPTPLVEYLSPPAKWDKVQYEILKAVVRQVEKARSRVEREPAKAVEVPVSDREVAASTPRADEELTPPEEARVEEDTSHGTAMERPPAPKWPKIVIAVAALVVVAIAVFLAFRKPSESRPLFDISPATGRVGTAVTISGSGFGSPQANSTVSFGGETARQVSWNNTKIVAEVPRGVTKGSVRVAVTVAGEVRHRVSFTVLNMPPSAENVSVNPETPTQGDSLRPAYTFEDPDGDGESGTEIRWYRNGTVVSQLNSSRQVSSALTSAGERWHFTVRPNDGTAFGEQVASDPVTVVSEGPLFDISPATGRVGTAVTISGSGFGSPQANSTVTFGGEKAIVKSWSDKIIVTSVPRGVTKGSVRVAVTVAGQVRHRANFTVLNMPPSAENPKVIPGKPTEEVAVRADYAFNDPDGDPESGTEIRWYRNGRVLSRLDDSRQVYSGLTSAGERWHFTIRPNDGTAFGEQVASDPVTVVSEGPRIRSVTPKSGVVGTEVTIEGSGFGGAQGTSTVTFGGVGAKASSWSDTEIMATLPDKVPSPKVSVVVTVEGVDSNSQDFTVMPIIEAIDPKFGAVGTKSEVTLIQATSHSGNDVQPAWSPDGKKIAFASGRGGNVDIWVMRMDETKVNLTNRPAYDGFPVWSPDGRKIVFASIREGERHPHIYVMDADGSNVKRLTNPEDAGPAGYSPEAAWSPDGDEIAFVRRVGVRSRAPEIWVMHSDGSQQRQLVGGSMERSGRQPEWSADGKYIYFYSIAPRSKFLEVWRARVDNTEEREQITKLGCRSEYFRFNPADPRKVALVLYPEEGSGERANPDIYVMNADGSDRQNISNHRASDTYPTWSPDGSRIAFSSNRSGNFDIWVAVLPKAGTSGP